MFQMETERLRMRLFRPSDVREYSTLVHSDADVMRYITGKPLPIERTEQIIARFISHHESHGYSVWAVTDKDDGTFMGHGGLITLPNGKDVEIDYAFGKAYWGKGYATEVARAVVQFGFEEAGLQRIYALAYTENSASRRVIDKLGMTYHGKSRQFYDIDLEVYSVETGAGSNR